MLEIKNCACGRPHTCPIREMVIGPKAIRKIPALLEGYMHVLLVSDTHTDAACGAKVRQLLQYAGFMVTSYVFPDEGHVVIPDEKSIAAIRAKLSPMVEVIVGVGSGVINDLCKYVSFFADLPYMIVATAPSMDGFASVGAAMILKGMKETVPARSPLWIIGDTDVLKDAPMEMIRAGAGDILGKISCLNDWKLAHVLRGEYFCETIYEMTRTEVDRCLQDIDGYLARDPAAITRLMNSLVQVGIAMAYMGNSRPASGSEHHLSHFYEITGVMNGDAYLPHGIDVGYATRVTCEMRRRLIQADPAAFTAPARDEAWEAAIDRVYSRIAPEVRALQAKTGFYAEEPLPAIREKWPELVQVMQEAADSTAVWAALEKLGFRWSEYLSTYGKQKLHDSILYAKDLKDRYTVLWVLWSTGLLAQTDDELTAEWFAD